MNNVQRLDWFCRLRSFLREPYVLITLGKDRKNHLVKYDEALSDEIARLEKLCYGNIDGRGVNRNVESKS